MQTQQGPPIAATSKFQLSIPFTLQQVSPALAALHASRTRILHYPDPAGDVLATTHCIKCGSFLLDGTGNIRTVGPDSHKRKRRKLYSSAAHTLRRSCGTCGYNDDVLLEKGNPLMFQRVGKRHKQSSERSAMPFPASSRACTQSQVTSQPESREHTPQGHTKTQQSPVPEKRSSHAPSPAPSPSPLPNASRSRSQTPLLSIDTSVARSKVRSKKKSGLQDMLARNRERQEQEKKKQTSSLSGFLEGS
ncbi:unnamed protein product [Somion occarium]|uniref:Uncharacterized protein n=1 Tax=Somion occarium TaxID=3059160 RepID=A0ABP1D2P3_9APHY